MALITTRRRSELALTAVLAPERYDPRRAVVAEAGSPLGGLASLRRELVRPGKPGPFLVLDTSDAQEGIVVARSSTIDALLSAKRIVAPGDVIISRLRPYLRQVAYLDEGIPGAPGARLVASSEFLVLSPRDGLSIAFLVPFLLSRSTQAILAASQEGGHHPRFRSETLLALPVPAALVAERATLSAQVLQSVQNFRASEALMREASARVEELSTRWRLFLAIFSCFCRRDREAEGAS